MDNTDKKLTEAMSKLNPVYKKLFIRLVELFPDMNKANQSWVLATAIGMATMAHRDEKREEKVSA